jgi:tetratricopeptide (TPR) repeat protein
MDLTSLTVAVLLALGLLTVDTVINSGSVLVEVAVSPKIENTSVDESTLEAAFQNQLDAIVETYSMAPLIARPEILSKQQQGIGMALAKAVNAQGLAYALQRRLGYRPDKIRFTLFFQDGAMRGFVSGESQRVGNFDQVFTPDQGETVIAFAQRCALWAASEIAPYSTALYLLQKHAADGDFTDVVALAEHAKALLPPTPTSFDRSLFDNLLGLVALFKNDPQAARTAFDNAMTADPTNPVPFLNGAFTDLQLDEYQKAVDRMERLMRIAPPSNKVLLGTTYMVWGAARIGLHDLPGADQLLAKSTEINPESATAFALWAELKGLEGDQAAVDRLTRLAGKASATFENYGEVAALYFHLAWADKQPVSRNKFSNPRVVTFH